MTRPRPPKTAHSNTPPRLRHGVGRFAKHRPNVYAKKEGRTIILAVVLLLPPAPCPGDAVFRCERESTLFGLPKEYTTRNQWLSCINNTVPEQFNPNIRVCAAHLTEDYFLNLGVGCQLCTKAVSIKCGNSNFARTVWRFCLTACKYAFLFKEFATEYSNASFELCRVVLVVCRDPITNAFFLFYCFCVVTPGHGITT